MSDAAQTKTVKKVCKCENCGNEAEMVVTCLLPSATAAPEVEEAAEAGAAPHHHEKVKVKGHGVCRHCGNEADMWVDI